MGGVLVAQTDGHMLTATTTTTAMASGGGDEPPPPSSLQSFTDAKGKGKAAASSASQSGQDAAATVAGRAANLLRSVAQSAQASVTPQALAGVLQSGGKGGAASSPSVGVSAQGLEDVRRAGAASSSASAGGVAASHSTSLRTAASDGAQQAQNSAYTHFSAPPSQDQLLNRFQDTLTLGSTSSSPPREALVGAFQSAAELDRPLHDYVRATLAASSQHNDSVLADVWNDVTKAADAETYPAVVHDPAYHEAWARTVPVAMFPPADTTAGDAQRPSEQALDFMGALASEEQADVQASSRQIRAVDQILPQAWQPPSPSHAPTLSAEQYALHVQLAEEQDGDEAQRAEERIRPPDDDREAQSGVYAATPEDALRAIWDGAGEGQRASEHVREERDARSTDGAEVVRRLRRMLSRGSYVDDVYGLPPALEATMKLAEQPESDANRDLRAKAISRLNALYNHLGDGGSTAAVRDWTA